MAALNIRFTNAKRKTLEFLGEYFCLRTHDLAKLLRSREPTENDKRTARHTLALLHEAGYVSRLPYLEQGREAGGVSFVYGLSDRGVSHVIAETPDLRLTAKTFDEHSQRTLDHELGISFFHISLTEYCRTNGFELYWQQKGLKKKTVAPDGYFAITDPRLPAGKDTLYYFLELERAKIGNVKDGEPSILRKLGRYYDYFDSDECQKEWGCFRQFRVIVVQSNQCRQQYLLTALASSIPHRMFWLTTEPLYRDNIGANIFSTPRDYAHQAYSFVDSRTGQIPPGLPTNEIAKTDEEYKQKEPLTPR